MGVSRKIFAATAAGALLSLTAVTGAQAVENTGPRYDSAMVQALASSLGVSESAAVQRLDRQAAQQDRVASLGKQGVAMDGAYFDGRGDLVVNAEGAAAERRIEGAGLKARVAEHGEDALQAVKAELDRLALAKSPSGVSAWSVDLASDSVVVEVSSDRGAAAAAFLKAARSHGDAVRVVKSAERLSPQATVDPGDQMTFDGYNCSVGYGARDASGKQFLVTAGHCIENLPVLSHDGARFAEGTDSRFALGKDSVDMGIAAVDEGSAISTQVSTWDRAGTVAVEGSERAPVGADLCKSGRTTFWTCGKVESYDVSVTYTDPNGGPDTVVTGLGSSSVCTEGGDSGGAYISGNQAQGMTSGGPSAQQCDGTVDSPGSSYFQPLDDALAHYGLTLDVN
ncbi:Alpha-lytic protease precursor [Streptomyces sp. ADI96-02]|uniref:S1 family peptidase n=1 Tax=Streptomyces sp. ADI96-02 TaxID=1522760 RepID=UPI000F54F060|nr:S1 family peptidase [Streptomyces sp. ADI96-02]RPK54880.1 Alpha-lytic protease precursor [Streptomyces sp. ADI96-02]